MSECVCLTTADQDQQAFVLMTVGELAAKLEELEHTKALAQTEFANLPERRRRVEELVRDEATVLALRSEAIVLGPDGPTSA